MVVGGSEGWRYGIDHTPVFGGCGCFNPVGGLIDPTDRHTDDLEALW